MTRQTSRHWTSRANCASNTMAAIMNRPVQSRRVRFQKRRVRRQAACGNRRRSLFMVVLVGGPRGLRWVDALQAWSARGQDLCPRREVVQNVENEIGRAHV